RRDFVTRWQATPTRDSPATHSFAPVRSLYGCLYSIHSLPPGRFSLWYKMAPKRVTLRTRRPSNLPAPEPQASSSETQATTTQREIQGSPENSSRDDLSDDEVADANVAALSVALEGSVPSTSDTQTAIAPPPRVSPLATSMRIPGSSTTATQTSLFQHMFRLQPTASGSRKGKEKATQASSGHSSSPVEGQDEATITHILANATNVPPPTHTPSSPPPHPREHVSASAAQTGQRRDKRTRPVEGDLDSSGGAPSFSRAELVSMLSNLQSSILEQCRQLVIPDVLQPLLKNRELN
ncbi:hypothetical protein JOM56_004755, partial [Amanita muscaria]